MANTQLYQVITKENLLSAARQRKHGGWQLTQISCTYKNGYDVLYSFERDYDMINLRLELDDGEWVESVSSVYPYAYLYENEIRDLFGLEVRGMNLDFQGNLYQIKVKAPFNVKTVEGEVSISNG